MRLVERFMGENAIGQQESVLTVEARAILLKTALGLLNMVQLLRLLKYLFRVLLPKVHNQLAEEEAEVDALLQTVKALLVNQHKEVLQPEST